MGVRLYDPSTGRFLQVHSVVDGSPNHYGYPVAPVMMYDLDGTNWWSSRYWKRRCIMLVGMLILSVIPYTAWTKIVTIAYRISKSLKRAKGIIRIVRRVVRGEGLNANSVVQGIFTVYFGWNDIKTACRKAW